jgi:hypothetical protein
MSSILTEFEQQTNRKHSEKELKNEKKTKK